MIETQKALAELGELDCLWLCLDVAPCYFSLCILATMR